MTGEQNSPIYENSTVKVTFNSRIINECTLHNVQKKIKKSNRKLL